MRVGVLDNNFYNLKFCFGYQGMNFIGTEVRMNIFLIRHGRQSSQLCNVDVDLAVEGREQAKLLGKRLSEYGIDCLYSSDLLRARETAEIAKIYLGNVDYRIRTELREIDFGRMTGNSDEYNNMAFADFKKKRMELSEDLPFPGGECGQDVVDRVRDVLEEMIHSGKQRIAVVTHGGVIRSIVTDILGMPQSKKLQFAVSLENTSITQLRFDRDYQRFYLERFNDFAHLEVNNNLLRRNW
jgi:probable phosphoglycerate mutase